MRSTAIAFALVTVASIARAQEPPKKLWTKFDTTTPHPNVASAACSLQGRTVVAGQYRPIEIHAQEDTAVICWNGPPNPDGVHTSVRMTKDPSRPTEVIVEVDIPDGTPPAVLEDLRNSLRNTVAELQRRTQPAVAQPPPQPPPQQVVVVQQPPPPPVPMHAEQVTNTGLIAAGLGTFAGGYVLSALMGAAILDAHGDPGTPRYWPFVPIIGATVFTATYVEAPNCQCAAGRVFSVLGAVAIDALQAAGFVMLIVGIAVPKTRMVPDAPTTTGIRLRPGGVLEGRF